MLTPVRIAKGGQRTGAVQIATAKQLSGFFVRLLFFLKAHQLNLKDMIELNRNLGR